MESTSLGILLLECDFVAFLKVGSALVSIGTSVFDVSIASKLLHAASAAQYAEIDSLQYGNSTLEKDNSALEYLKYFLDHLESTSLGILLLECDFVAFLKVGSTLVSIGTLVYLMYQLPQSCCMLLLLHSMQKSNLCNTETPLLNRIPLLSNT